MQEKAYRFVEEMRRKGCDLDDIFRAIAEVYESVIQDELSTAKAQLKKHGF